MQPDQAHTTAVSVVLSARNRGLLNCEQLGRLGDKDLANMVAAALRAAREEGCREGAREMREAAAKVADGFGCGACGMDGKAAAAIRALPLPGEGKP